MACFNSTPGWQDHNCRFLQVNSTISERSFSFRLSEPKRFKIKFLRYLCRNPWLETIFSFPTISSKLSMYQLWTNFPSCWKMKWLTSGSVETTIFRPTRLVRNNEPYLEKVKKIKIAFSEFNTLPNFGVFFLSFNDNVYWRSKLNN